MSVERLLMATWVLVDGWMLVAVAGYCCWLLLLVAAAGCCCWLLLLIAVAGCCCWLLLLVAAVDCFCWLLLLIAAVGCCCWLLNECWLLLEYCLFLVAAVDCWMIASCCKNTACWPESPRIFPGFWWFVVETILKGKMSLNISRLLMKRIIEWGFCFEFMMRPELKRSSPRGSRLVGGNKRKNIMVVHWVFIAE